MHSYEDNTKFHSTFSATTLSYASHFWRNWGVMENFEYLGDFWKCWLYCVLYLLVIERCKKKLKNRLWQSCACLPLRTHSKGFPTHFFYWMEVSVASVTNSCVPLTSFHSHTHSPRLMTNQNLSYSRYPPPPSYDLFPIGWMFCLS